jgi:hypothetical protein
MNKTTNNEGRQGKPRDYWRILEFLLVLAVIPALVHGVASLNSLPVA